MIQKILLPRTLRPKNIEIRKPKSLLINEQIYKNEQKQLTFAAGSGGVPPSGDDFPSSFKKPFSPEYIKKIHEITKDMNKLTRKGFDIINKYSKFIK
ncbi:hypothetical protein IJ674_03595 [bacterium]|nr:hypothetical protein [bacterium]